MSKPGLEAEIRQRLGHDLHDGPLQLVVGAKMFSEALLHQAEAGKPLDVELLRRTIALLSQAVADTRDLILGMRPPESPRDWVADLQTQHASSAPQVVFEITSAAAECSGPHHDLFYRIADEAIRNARRHAQAQRITVSLAVDDQALVLKIEDNGQGFDPEELPEDHFGVRGMRERATLHGGELHITSAPGQGTIVTCRIPIAPAA